MVWFGGEINLAVMGLDNAFDQGQAEARTGAINALETIEDPFAVRLGDADTGIGNQNFKHVVQTFGPHFDPATGAREGEGIAEQVEKALFKQSLIAVDQPDIGRTIDFERHFILAGAIPHQRDNTHQAAVKIDGLAFNIAFSSVDNGQVEHIIDQVRQGCRGSDDGLRIFLLALVQVAHHAARQQFSET